MQWFLNLYDKIRNEVIFNYSLYISSNTYIHYMHIFGKIKPLNVLVNSCMCYTNIFTYILTCIFMCLHLYIHVYHDFLLWWC